jgi:hypothetical protein
MGNRSVCAALDSVIEGAESGIGSNVHVRNQKHPVQSQARRSIPEDVIRLSIIYISIDTYIEVTDLPCQRFM